MKLTINQIAIVVNDYDEAIEFYTKKLLFAVIILMLSLVVAMYATLAERKVAGFFQAGGGGIRCEAIGAG